MSKKIPIPVFNHPIIETHCHLDYLEGNFLQAALDAAKAVNVERLITIAVSPDNLEKVMQLAQNHEQVWGTQGIHPHDAKDYTAAVEAQIRTNALHPKMLAIGEIGLDYFYDHSDRVAQRKAFESQLQIAIDLELPIVVHTRDADEDTQAILQNFVGQMKKRGVIHSFTSGKALAEYCLGEGFCLGFNGISTFKPAENVREIIGITPVEQTLFETDAPYLTADPFRGKRNRSDYIKYVIKKIAMIKGLDETETAEILYDNAMRFFKVKDS